MQHTHILKLDSHNVHTGVENPLSDVTFKRKTQKLPKPCETQRLAQIKQFGLRTQTHSHKHSGAHTQIHMRAFSGGQGGTRVRFLHHLNGEPVLQERDACLSCRTHRPQHEGGFERLSSTGYSSASVPGRYRIPLTLTEG